MVKPDIIIKKEQLGFSFEKVNLLLEEFSKAEKVEDKEDFIIQLDFEEGGIQELGLTLTKRFIDSRKGSHKKRKYIVKNESMINSLLGLGFFGNFLGMAGIKIKNKKVVMNYSFFAPFAESGVNQEGKINSILNDLMSNFIDEKKQLHTEVRLSVIELISNAFDHTQSKEDVSCICTLSKDDKKLEFCIVDSGNGIKSSLLSNPAIKKKYLKKKNHEILEEVTNLDVSCNPEENPHPKYDHGNGGMGLYYLSELIKEHHLGKMVIISGDGYYSVGNNHKIKKRQLSSEWKGTAVWFRIDMSQEVNKIYTRKVEESLDHKEEKRSIKNN